MRLRFLAGVSVLVLVAAPVQAQDDTLRIISLNTWGARSLVPEATDLFATGKYDVITIQEYNSDYGRDLQTKLNDGGSDDYALHSRGDKGVASRLPGSAGAGSARNAPYVMLSASARRPETIVATEHLNWYDNAFDARVGQAKQLNDWAAGTATPIIMTGDFNAGDVSERGLLEVVQQELMLTRARQTGNPNYKEWALQYVARNHAVGSEKYKAAEAYIDRSSDTRPTDLFTNETYPVEGNLPYTMNILKKEYQLLQNPEDKEPFSPHGLADGSTTWPSVEEDDEAFKWPSWGRTQIDHFVASRPYAKWWTLEDAVDDKHVGGVLDQSVSTTADGKALSDHEPIAHELRWAGPIVEDMGDGSGKVRLIFNKNTNDNGGKNEFQLSRNNGRSDVYLGQLSDENGVPFYRLPEDVPASAVQGRLPQAGDPDAPLKVALDCSDKGHLELQGAREMCVDDHQSFKDILVGDGKTVAIDESEALGASDGLLVLDNGGIRTAGLTDQWAAWTDPLTGIDKAIRLDGPAWIDVSHPTVPVETRQAITGAGSLEKRGKGTLVLGAVNSYTGSTRVEGGILRAGVEGAFVDDGAYIINAGTLDLADHDLTMSSLSGLGGTLAIGAGELILDQAAGTTYAGAISGDGRFAKSGKGALALTGNSAGFNGATEVAGGVLSVNGKLGGSVEVLDTATLGGSGTVGSTVVASGGTLAPGNSIGTLTVDGDLTFAAGSRFAVEANPATRKSDLVTVTGNAVVDGGSVAHVGVDANYDLRSTYTILSAGDLSGGFDSVTSDFAFLTPDLLYDYRRGTIGLQLERNDTSFASAAQTGNQKATARAIESIGIAATHEVYDAVALLPDDRDLIRSSFDQLSGEIHASAKSALIEESGLLRNAISDRVRSAFGGVATTTTPVLAYGPGGADLSMPGENAGLAAWGHAFGSWGSIDGNAGVAGLDTSTGGFLLGADASIADAWRLGLLGGYSRSSFEADGRNSSGSSDNFHLGLYGGSQWGQLTFQSGLAYTWHQIETSRSVGLPGLANRLGSDYDAGTLQMFGEFGYRIDTAIAALEPFANLAHVRLDTKGYEETGGAAGLHSSGQATDTTFTTLGVRASADFDLAETQVSLKGMVGWRHAFGDTASLSTHAFSGSDSFTVSGAPVAKDAAIIEAGLDLSLTEQATLGVTYQGQFGGGFESNGLNANLQIKF